jgi:hypothetical protein
MRSLCDNRFNLIFISILLHNTTLSEEVKCVLHRRQQPQNSNLDPSHSSVTGN